MGKATSKAKMEIAEKCVCRMGNGRKLTLIFVVGSINGELVGRVTSGLNAASWCVSWVLRRGELHAAADGD